MDKSIWRKEDITIEFKDGSMQFFNEEKKAEDINDVLYFYYTIDVTQRNNDDTKILTFRTHDFPKVQNLSAYIDCLIKFNIEKDGYLLEDYKNTFKDNNGNEKTFYRKVFYHQIELSDILWSEYFIRLERYDYQIKQYQEQECNEYKQYKMTIGKIPYNSKSEAGLAFFFNVLEEKELIALKEIADDFVKNTIAIENRNIDKGGN